MSNLLFRAIKICTNTIIKESDLKKRSFSFGRHINCPEATLDERLRKKWHNKNYNLNFTTFNFIETREKITRMKGKECFSQPLEK